MYTKQDHELAKDLCSNKQYLELIVKIFLQSEDKLDHSFVASKTNEELGEVVRANALAEQKIKLRYDHLKMLATRPPVET